LELFPTEQGFQLLWSTFPEPGNSLEEKMKRKLFDPHKDALLVVAYQQNQDSRAFSALYEKYFSPVRLYCQNKLQDKEDALDVTQDIFIRAATNLHNLRTPETFAAWLFMIAKNCCLDQLNMRKKKFSQLTGIHFQLSEEETDMEEMLALEKMLESLLILFDQLDESSRMLLSARYMEKRSIREIANLFNLKESAVKMRLARTRRRLGKMLCLPHIEAVNKKHRPFQSGKD
jgi:RNA polymerase sigma factor (sigma-70 family)